MKVRSLVTLLLALVLAAGGIWAVWFSPWLRVRDVQLTIINETSGQWHDLTLRTRIEAALPQLTGQPLARVDSGAIAQQLSRLRGVQSADVRRGWPTTVAVIVRPRVPVAVFARVTHGKTRWQLLDRSSTVVAEVAQPLPDWVVLGVSPASVGGRAAMSVWSALPTSMRSKVALMTARDTASDSSVEFTFRNGATVVWGSLDRTDRKVQVLQALLRYKAKVYDVSSPDVPTTRETR